MECLPVPISPTIHLQTNILLPRQHQMALTTLLFLVSTTDFINFHQLQKHFLLRRPTNVMASSAYFLPSHFHADSDPLFDTI